MGEVRAALLAANRRARISVVVDINGSAAEAMATKCVVRSFEL
jgi:hypothetical protein